MPIELKLPDVGEGIAEEEVVRWLVAEGAAVKEDDPMVVPVVRNADAKSVIEPAREIERLSMAAILAARKIVTRPVVCDGEIVLREMMYLSLSFDHRIVDGGEAMRCLNEVVRRIEASAT
jgi:pyruvate/2-oxoglutarate dehydrogenase complex dihydrolipoamide acyltransferase (E2) component